MSLQGIRENVGSRTVVEENGTFRLQPEQVKIQLIMGLIPCQNQYILNVVSPVIMPGLRELERMAMEEYTAGQIMNDILFGAKQLHMAYLEKSVFVPEDKYQEQFISYMQNPQEKFVGFTIIEPLRHSGFHIFGLYIMPEYRETNVIKYGLTYLEEQARKMGSPYLSAATRHDVSGALAKLGFMETTCNYRKKLKE